jgi:superkiller protein 3
LVSRGQLDDALGEYQQALKFQPDNAKAHYNLGNVLADRGQTSAAIDEYQKALDIAPDCVVAYNNLGAVLAGNGRIDEAVPNFEEALKINPHFADAHNNLGMALEQQGKIAEAMMHWRESVQLNPKDVRILKKLAWTMATHPDASVRNGEEAVELAEWAVRLSGGSDPALFVTLAAAYAEAGRFSEAVKTAERALALATANKDAETAQALQEQIKLYRACSPFHEARSLQ